MGMILLTIQITFKRQGTRSIAQERHKEQGKKEESYKLQAAGYKLYAKRFEGLASD
jgi:hypothetical protein